MKNIVKFIKESVEEVLVITHDEDDDLICVSAFWGWLREAGFQVTKKRHNWPKLDKKYGSKKYNVIDDKVDEAIEFINKGTSGFKTKSMTLKVKSENGSCEVSTNYGDIAHIKYTKDKA